MSETRLRFLRLLRRAGLPLLACAALAGSAPANLLTNPGFEIHGSGGTTLPWPWGQGYYPETAGSETTGTAARSGSYGCWTFTYIGPDASFSRVRQDLPAAAGQILRGAVWARTAPINGEGSWVAGSSARLHLSFLSGTGVELASYGSEALTEAGRDWTRLEVTSGPAPSGTAQIRYYFEVAKPAGPAGQSVAAFDDCLLEEVLAPVLSPSARVFGFGLDLTQLGFSIANAGSDTLTWSLVPDGGWMTAVPASGTTTTERDSVVITVTRAGLSANQRFHGRIAVHSNGGTDTLHVYLENFPNPQIPSAPSEVTTDGYRLWVRKRLPNGTLAERTPWMIRGVAWSPASIGTPNDRWARQAEFARWYRLDLQMIREMNANTVYLFLDPGTGQEAIPLLDCLYLNDLMAVVTVDWDGTYEVPHALAVVTALRQHPAILCWAIGNEWNVNLYHDRFDTLMEAAEATQELAAQLQTLDADHPVASIYGEIDMGEAQPLSLTEQIVNDICPAVDLWGCNIYRGPTFGTFFNQWASISNKPVFLSEYGADSFFTTGQEPLQGHVDENAQAEFNHGLWMEIAGHLSCCDPAGVCLGGTVFEWVDEWWKTGSPWLHEPDGFYPYWNPGAFPDSFANEEYFGVVAIDRIVKATYRRYVADYAAGPVGPCAVESGNGGGTEPGGSGGPGGSRGPAGPRRPGIGLRWERGDQILSVGDEDAKLVLELLRDAHVTVTVVDLSGRQVRRLFDGPLESGKRVFRWDGRDEGTRAAPSGVYLVTAAAEGEKSARKVVVAR